MAKPRITDPVEPIQYAPERGAVALSSDRPVVSKRSLTGFGDHHPNDGNPPRSGAYRSRLDRGQPIAREPGNAFVNPWANMSATVRP